MNSTLNGGPKPLPQTGPARTAVATPHIRLRGGRAPRAWRPWSAMMFLLPLPFCAFGQQNPWNPDDVLDPTRSVASPQLESAVHRPLPEAYIWTAGDSVNGDSEFDTELGRSKEIAPHYFRRAFQLDAVPAAATLYIAGPRSVRAYVNGKLVERVESSLDSPLGMQVYAQDVTSDLKPGANVIAIEAVRGRGEGSDTNSRLTLQQTIGKVLAVKLVPAARGVDAPALVVSDAQWKGSQSGAGGWEGAGFDDSTWAPAKDLGGIESSIDLLQWNADAGLYDWPGYDGISPFLAHLPLRAVSVSHAYAGSGLFHNLGALSGSQPGQEEFSVELPAKRAEGQFAPQVLLDFGREVNGRLQFESDSPEPAEVTVQYGESEAEAVHGPYLGTNALYIAPGVTAYGPKSAFRFALVRFIGGGVNLRFKSIHVDGIYYPVQYQGSFSSSDPQLNLMWAVGAYTAHLCMQDGIWDAPKRDRGLWMGDLDVSGRTIDDVFADHFLMEDSLDRLLVPVRLERYVDDIPGYSAFWVTGEAEYYRHAGSKQQLAPLHDRLVHLLHYMEKDLDGSSLFAHRIDSFLFVDWAPDLYADTPAFRCATQCEFYAAFSEGAYLLNELGDAANARLFLARADQVKAAAQSHMLDSSTGSFGPRWQTNAAAVVSGAADPSQYASIWKASLASVGKIKYNALIITPYYNYYVITAMARMGHRTEALDWIRQYWGGMVRQGATSFWEGYDPSWYKDDFHASLQADAGSGYFVSLAHGWSSGVTPWLMEQVLGIRPTAAGFSAVDIRPDLIDLEWAKGGEPTPRGMLMVGIKKTDHGVAVSLDLPPGTEARVSMPVTGAGAGILVNGTPEPGAAAEDGARSIVTLAQAGHFELSSR